MKKIKLLALTALLSATAVISACTATAEQCDPSIELMYSAKLRVNFPAAMISVLNKKRKFY